MNDYSATVSKKTIVISLLTYTVCATVFGLAYRYVINPDGIALLRLAGYIAEGEFYRSVVSGWSPLIVWLISLFLSLGFDGLTAARLAIGVSGSGLLLCFWFISRRFFLTPRSTLIASLIAALLISFWNVQFITADVLIASMTLWYLYLVTAPDILTGQKKSFAAGAVGGLSYLAHHYAFPFFMIHFPLLLGLSWYFRRNEPGYPMKRVLVSWVTGIAGFMFVSSLWIGAVSIKEGHLTISSKGGIAHAVVGPKDVDRRHPFFVGGLYQPKEPYAIHVFEDPSDIPFKTWSPFESREYFMHQLKLILNNARYILNHFVFESPFFTYAFIVGVLTLIPIALLLRKSSGPGTFLYSWVLVTFVIYSSGFLLLIARSPRRFYALMLLFLLFVFHILENLISHFRETVSGRRLRMLTFYLFVIAVAAFAVKPAVHMARALSYIVMDKPVNPYKEMADQISTISFPAPYAIIRSTQKPHTDTYIAYYLGLQFLGRPNSRDTNGIANEMKISGARSLLVFDNMEIVGMLQDDGRFVHVSSLKLKNPERYADAVNVNIRDHEIITGWDTDVSIFRLAD